MALYISYGMLKIVFHFCFEYSKCLSRTKIFNFKFLFYLWFQCWSNRNLSLVPLYFNRSLTSSVGIGNYGNSINRTNTSSATLQRTDHPGEDFSLNYTNVNNDFSIYSTMDWVRFLMGGLLIKGLGDQSVRQ